MFNVSSLLLDDALKPATPLTNGAISGLHKLGDAQLSNKTAVEISKVEFKMGCHSIFYGASYNNPNVPNSVLGKCESKLVNVSVFLAQLFAGSGLVPS